MGVRTDMFSLPCHCVSRFPLVVVVLKNHSFHLFLQDCELTNNYPVWAMPHTKQWSEWKTLKEAIPSMPPVVYTEVKLRSSRNVFGTRILSSIKLGQNALRIVLATAASYLLRRSSCHASSSSSRGLPVKGLLTMLVGNFRSSHSRPARSGTIERRH